MTRRDLFRMVATTPLMRVICASTALGVNGAWQSLPRIQQVIQSGNDLWMRVGSGWRHGAVAQLGFGRLADGARFIAYRHPERVGWQGWIEDVAGRVVGWVNLQGQAIPTHWV